MTKPRPVTEQNLGAESFTRERFLVGAVQLMEMYL